MDKSACIKFAGSLLGTWKPVPWQGAHTYTLYDEDNCAILQFRGPSEKFDREILDLAVAVHGQLVAKAQYLGTVPEQPWVLIWYIERMPRDPYLFHASSLAPEQVLAAVADLAIFFVSAWKLPQLSQVTKADRYNAALQELLIALPEEFHKVNNRVKDHLKSILALPWVLTHTDLAAGNMLVDPSTGHLTGVVDWAEAIMEPFRLALWGLEDILGSHGPQGYTYSIESKTGYDLFRQIFISETGFDGDAELLEWARLLGIFIRHGYIWDSILKARVPISQDLDLQLLRICIKAHLFSDLSTKST